MAKSSHRHGFEKNADVGASGDEDPESGKQQCSDGRVNCPRTSLIARAPAKPEHAQMGNKRTRTSCSEICPVQDPAVLSSPRFSASAAAAKLCQIERLSSHVHAHFSCRFEPATLWIKELPWITPVFQVSEVDSMMPGSSDPSAPFPHNDQNQPCQIFSAMKRYPAHSSPKVLNE